jgi:hypothetical protein
MHNFFLTLALLLSSCTSWRIAYLAAAVWQGLRLHRGPCIGVGPLK